MGYREKDAAKDTAVTPREVTNAWHHARDESGVRAGSRGDRPTAQNRADAERLQARVVQRGRERERERSAERERER